MSRPEDVLSDRTEFRVPVGDGGPERKRGTGHAASGRIERRAGIPVGLRSALATAEWVVAASLLLLAILAGTRMATPEGREVTLVIDGRSEHLLTLRSSLAGLLAEQEVEIGPADRILPDPQGAVEPGMVVRVERARPVSVTVDGDLRLLATHSGTVGELLHEAGIRLRPQDEVWLDGQIVGTTVSFESRRDGGGLGAMASIRGRSSGGAPPLHLTIRRAVPIEVNEGSAPYVIYTTAPTIGEALWRAGVTLYLGDEARPSLATPARAGMRVMIFRSKLVVVSVDGRTMQTRTRGKTVGDALVDLGVVVTGADRVIPALEEPLFDNSQIRIARVREAVEVERTLIPYESVMVPDDTLEIDNQRLAQAGQDGEHRRRFRVVYEDGQEVSRTALDEWTAAQPVTRISAYGRKLVSRPLETAEGTLSYWRKIRMYATAYSPARSGTPRSAAWYGRTRIGLSLAKGIVAVDPSVIPLRTRVYVPGYGVAIAGDTGGGVRGKMIDLGYEDNDYVSWHQWVDVYVLDPSPAAANVRWVLPNYPPPGFPRRRS